MTSPREPFALSELPELLSHRARTASSRSASSLCTLLPSVTFITAVSLCPAGLGEEATPSPRLSPPNAGEAPPTPLHGTEAPQPTATGPKLRE